MPFRARPTAPVGLISLALLALVSLLAFVSLLPSQALADGAATTGAGEAEGCPGDAVVFNLTLRYDNCAGFALPPGAIGPGAILQTSGPPWAAAFIPPVLPAVFPPGILCTPPNGAFRQWLAPYTVTVIIPAGAVPGTVVTYDIIVPIVPGTASIFAITVTALDCAGGGGGAAAQDDPDNPAPGGGENAAPGARVMQARGETGEFAADKQPNEFVLYGAEGSVEGTFQASVPAGPPDLQGWVGVDRTETASHWHASTFNAENLGGPGNTAMWSGADAGALAYGPGYGNEWNDLLEFRYVVDPGLSHDVQLQFDYNIDLEAGFDIFSVELDRNFGPPEVLMEFSGNSGGAAQLFDQTFTVFPGEFVGPNSDEIRLVLRVRTNASSSDEDGFYDSNGAVQLDNVSVNIDAGLVSFADFEPGGSDGGWISVSTDFAGDFSRVFGLLTELDFCVTNLTPRVAFLDDGTPPNNAPGQSTGGSLSGDWVYGPGGYVVNYTGGLSYGVTSLHNELVSPPIDVDLPGGADDVANGGFSISYDVFQHAPYENAIYHTWRVRSYRTDLGWTEWRDHGFQYYAGFPEEVRRTVDVSSLIVSGAEQLQLALGVQDFADEMGLPGNDAAPAPYYDNVRVSKFAVGGPVIRFKDSDLFQDSFPNHGGLDFETDPAALAIRTDRAGDTSGGLLIAPADGMAAYVVPKIPGTALIAGSPTLHWILEANPAFDGVRTIAGTLTGTIPGPDGQPWDVYEGQAAGAISPVPGPAALGRHIFDIPGDDGPGGVFFPGDRMRYYIRAEDDLGNVSFAPADLTGFGGADEHDARFALRGLPSLYVDDSGETPVITQPPILIVAASGHDNEEASVRLALQQLGYVPDVDFDVYTVKAAGSLVSNGIGSAGAHGATAVQMDGYTTVIYAAGRQSFGVMSDGTDQGGNTKSPDIALLTAWWNLPGDSNLIVFGDQVGSSLSKQGNETLTFLQNVLHVDFIDEDSAPLIAGQVTPIVASTGVPAGAFIQDFVAFASCGSGSALNAIVPLGGTAAVAAHEFLDENGNSAGYLPAASVWSSAMVGPDTKTAVTFAFAFSAIRERLAKAPAGPTAAAKLLGETLVALGFIPSGPATANPGALTRRFVVHPNHPNPFNPATSIEFEAPRAGRVTARVYNARGERVRTLLDGEVTAGRHELKWLGRDDRGREVSSGVYFYRVEGFGKVFKEKMALLK